MEIRLAWDVNQTCVSTHRLLARYLGSWTIPIVSDAKDCLDSRAIIVISR